MSLKKLKYGENNLEGINYLSFLSWIHWNPELLDINEKYDKKIRSLIAYMILDKIFESSGPLFPCL